MAPVEENGVGTPSLSCGQRMINPKLEDIEGATLCGVNGVPPAELPAPPVVLRRYRGDELPALLEAVTSSLDHLRPWMPWAAAAPLEPSLAEFISGSVEQFDRGENFHYAIWDDEAGKLVGGTGLHPRLGPGRIEIGYWVRDGWLRRGIAKAAAEALTTAALALPGVVEVHIHCDEANSASAAIPRRLGYGLLGVVADEITAPGEVGQSMEWATTLEKWRHGSGARGASTP